MPNDGSRILIAGSYGHGNTGDEAILVAITDQLRARMAQARITVVAGDTEAISQQFGVETVAWDDWAAIAQTVQQSDMVIQGGGGIFFDYSGFHPWGLFENGAPDLAHYGGFSLLAALYSKPLMIYSAGVGPLVTQSGREMVRLAHSLAQRITVRDAESKSLLEEIGVNPDCVEVTADPAFSLRPADEARAREILSQYGIDLERPIVALAPRPWSYGVDQSDWERPLADALSAFAAARQAQVLLIPFQKGYDEATVSSLRDRLAGSETFVLESHYAPQEVAAVIGACDLLVGLRLHSILFAILTGTPAVALAYDPKVRSLARSIGREDICFDLIDLSHLADKLYSVWERREELSRDFAESRARMKALAERNADLACSLLTAQSARAALSEEFRDLFAKAFYGRLQAVRVRDYVIARRDDTAELREVVREVVGVMNAVASDEPDAAEAALNDLRLLREFIQSAALESAEHLVLIYDGEASSEDAAGLASSFAARAVPTILVCRAEEAAAQSNFLEQDRLVFRLPVATMVASWDEALRASTPTGCRKVLLLRSADRNTFRLINHAHAMGWTSVYYPRRLEGRAPREAQAEQYVINNAEHVIIGSRAMRDNMRAEGVQRALVVAGSESAEGQAAEVLALAAEQVAKSPVRMAVEGASRR